jgi:hypothetical protein
VSVFKNSGVNEALLGRVADTLYEDARCGFFHDGIFRERILFSGNFDGSLLMTMPRVNGKPDVNGEIQSIVINPKHFIQTIETHFMDYVRLLRDSANTELRDNFKKAVEIKWRLNTPGPIVGMDEQEFMQHNKGMEGDAP